jgi:hypothetical protein
MTLQQAWELFLVEVDEDEDIAPSTLARLVLRVCEEVDDDTRTFEVVSPSLNDVVERLLDS